MKGPGNRIRLIVQRRWECPRCGRRVLTGGEVVQLRCDCQAEENAPPTWMKLIDDPMPIPPPRPKP